MSSENGINSILKVLDYTKSNKKWFDDKSLVAGYHSVSINGQRFKGQRDPEARLKKVNYDFINKSVLDIGCSNGGLLHALSSKIKFGVGIDFNSKCINAANALKAINETSNIHFYSFDLDKEDLSLLKHFLIGNKVDICFFFNISIWVKRWKEVFQFCADLTDIMLFEAHGNTQQQHDQIEFIHSVYKDVVLLSEQSEDDPTYANRKMFICKHKADSVHPSKSSRPALKIYDEETVIQAYIKFFPENPVTDVQFFPNTHESTVAKINHEHIVKISKPHRDANGLKSEKIVTDLMKDRVKLAIPQISIVEDEMITACYKALPGRTLDKKKFGELSEGQKDALAAQLAKFMSDFHSVSISSIKRAQLPLSPSWELSTDLIEEQLSDTDDKMISNLLPEVVSNHKSLQVTESNLVFGHFDLHAGNVLVNDSHNSITGIIDFGNCKIGDIHQDLSVMNLSSPELAKRVLKNYKTITRRMPSERLIQHYTTIFYLHLLAGLKRKKAEKQFHYWHGQLEEWYIYLLEDRAQTKINSSNPSTKIPPTWKKWVASSLMKGYSPTSVRNALWNQGFSHVDAEIEITLASNHPYIQAGEDIFHVLEKRNWLLKTCDSLAALDRRYSTQIEIRPTPSYDIFVQEYYSKHIPVVLTGGIDHWQALKKWTPEFLLDAYGDKEIEVQYGRENDPLFERNSGKHKKMMLMRDYVSLIQNCESSNNFYMTANNTKNSMPGIESLFSDLGDFGEGYRQLASPTIGTFFWFGPKGAFTPLHHDLTNNMLVQVYGRKKVTLIPAFQVECLYNDKGVFSAADYPKFDAKKHPDLSKVTPLEIIIGPGDSLFIPIGWWHCVEALDPTISVSFTNFNAPNQFSSEFPRN